MKLLLLEVIVKVIGLSLDEFVSMFGDVEDNMRRKDEIFSKYYPEIKKRKEERLERERIEREKKEKKRRRKNRRRKKRRK